MSSPTASSFCIPLCHSSWLGTAHIASAETLWVLCHLGTCSLLVLKPSNYGANVSWDISSASLSPGAFSGLGPWLLFCIWEKRPLREQTWESVMVSYWWSRRLGTLPTSPVLNLLLPQSQAGRVLSSMLALASPLISLGKAEHLSSLVSGLSPLKFRGLCRSCARPESCHTSLHVINPQRWKEKYPEYWWQCSCKKKSFQNCNEQPCAEILCHLLSIPFTVISCFYIMFYWNPFFTLML